MFDIGRFDSKALMRSVCVAAIVTAATAATASAQQTIAPVSNTPVVPMPDVLAKYAPVTCRAPAQAGGRQLAAVPPHL